MDREGNVTEGNREGSLKVRSPWFNSHEEVDFFGLI